MAKQINQYTKTRTAATTKDDDYLDFDSTEDNGSTFESAKITVLQFVTYLITKIPTFFSSDGAIAETRNVEMNGFNAEFENGNIINKAALADVGYKLQDSLGNEKGSLGYDVSLDTATLELKDATSSYFVATDGGVGIGTVPTSARLTVRGDTVGAEATLIVSNQIGTQAMLVRNDSSVIIGGALFRHPSYDATLAMGASSTEANKIRLDDDAGGSAFVVRKGGTVGVGIAIPAARLHVVHPAGLSGPLTLQVVGSAAVESLAILNDGNVGLGTVLPTAKLHVEGSVRLNTTIASAIGEVWTATDILGNGAWAVAGGGADNIYTADGVLTSIRTVTLGSNNLTFLANSSGILKYDSDSISGGSPYYEFTAGAIGLKRVVQTQNVSGAWEVGSDLSSLTAGSMGFSGGTLSIDNANVGNVIQGKNTALGTNVFEIGKQGEFLCQITTVNSYLKWKFDQGLEVRGNANNGNLIRTYDTSGIEVFNVKESGDTGIGLAGLAPSAKLHVKDSTSGSLTSTFLVQSNTTDLLNVLDDGSVGVGVVSSITNIDWKTSMLSVKSSQTYSFYADGSGTNIGLSVVTSNGKVGIGSLVSGTRKFEVVNDSAQTTIARFESSTGAFGLSILNTGQSAFGSNLVSTVNALVDFNTTSQGIKLPNVSTGQRDSWTVGASDRGLSIMNSTSGLFNFYDGTAWVEAGGGGGGAAKYSEQFNASLETLGIAKEITHSLATTAVIVQLWDDATGAIIDAEIDNRTANTLDVTFNGLLPSGNVTIIILG